MSESSFSLPTLYNGITFRSRTEARWAVLFDNLELSWEYEPQGYNLDGDLYLPDFRLTDFPLWVEVKPDETSGEECSSFAKMCDHTKTKGFIAYGQPEEYKENILLYRPDRGWAPEMGAFLLDRRDDGIYWVASDGFGTTIGGPGKMTDHDKHPVVRDPLDKAIAAARSEKFGIR